MTKEIILVLEDDIDVTKLIRLLKVLQQYQFYFKDINIDYEDSKEGEDTV